MLRLYSAATLPDAHLLCQLLAHAGIEAHVFNENAQSGMGEIPFTHAWPEVWIERDADMKRAREIVRSFERPPVHGADVVCPSCRERNPGNFELCWSCGTGL